LPVSAIFENLEAGSYIEEIIEQFRVTREQIENLMAFVARSLDKAPELPVKHRSLVIAHVHVHARDNVSGMRTTIEMKPEHRIRILELAATRGEKGFSAVVAEALDLYLDGQKARAAAIQNALALKGSMNEAEASHLLAQTRRIRANWR